DADEEMNYVKMSKKHEKRSEKRDLSDMPTLSASFLTWAIEIQFEASWRDEAESKAAHRQRGTRENIGQQQGSGGLDAAKKDLKATLEWDIEPS
ncbi:4264_t:CDS:2, partial [Acaulospora colombiana]